MRNRSTALSGARALPSKRSLLRLGLAAGLLAAAGAAFAQDRPALRIIVPFPAGGISDVMARLVGASMAKTLNRTVIVDNRPGAAGLIGTRAVLAAPADGNTLLFHYIGLAGLPFTQKGANYDPIKDFVPVGMVCDGPAFVVVHSSVPAKNMGELIAYAKTLPAGLEAATSGPGGGSQMWTMLLAKSTGANLLAVPYKGGSEMTMALTTGEAKLMISNLSEPLNGQVKAGKLRLLAVASETPSALAPGLPMANQTVPDYNVAGWYGLFAAAGTPAADVAAQSEAIHKAVEDPSIREKFLSMYVEPKFEGPTEFAATMLRTQTFWKRVVGVLGMSPQ